jgi:nucleotide sugar dehydrogenase
MLVVGRVDVRTQERSLGTRGRKSADQPSRPTRWATMKICVHGLGYIGLASAALFATDGHEVVGYDVDDRVTERLRAGDPDVSEPSFASFVERALDTNLVVGDDPVAADYHLVCVPTPYDQEREQAVLSAVEQATETVAGLVRRGDTVVIESTVPPGTTSNLVAGTLTTATLAPGEGIELGYTPETVMPGNTITELRTNDRIVGGVDAASTAAIRELYDPVTDGTIHTAPDPTTAEFVKLAQNAARDVEIAYANSLALLADDYGVDVRTAIELANSHPRVDLLDPGPGVGGHCIPIDPLFLGQESDETTLIDAARSINDRMPGHVVDRLGETLGSIDGANVAIFGITYKGDVRDTRNSPGLAIARRLSEDDAALEANAAEASEPLDPDTETDPDYPEQPRAATDGTAPAVDVRVYDPVLGVGRLDDAVGGADAVVLATAHEAFADLDPGRIGERVARRVVVDPLDLLDADRWTDHGFDVVTL